MKIILAFFLIFGYFIIAETGWVKADIFGIRAVKRLASQGHVLVFPPQPVEAGNVSFFFSLPAALETGIALKNTRDTLRRVKTECVNQAKLCGALSSRDNPVLQRHCADTTAPGGIGARFSPSRFSRGMAGRLLRALRLIIRGTNNPDCKPGVEMLLEKMALCPNS